MQTAKTTSHGAQVIFYGVRSEIESAFPPSFLNDDKRQNISHIYAVRGWNK
jgi:hypothetical protein